MSAREEFRQAAIEILDGVHIEGGRRDEFNRVVDDLVNVLYPLGLEAAAKVCLKTRNVQRIYGTEGTHDDARATILNAAKAIRNLKDEE